MSIHAFVRKAGFAMIAAGGWLVTPWILGCSTSSGGDTSSSGGGEYLTDPHNCGAAGHDCLGGTCDDGLCGAVVLASFAGRINSIAPDSTYVYASEGARGSDEQGYKPGGIFRMPIAGGAAEQLQADYTGDSRWRAPA